MLCPLDLEEPLYFIQHPVVSLGIKYIDLKISLCFIVF